MKVDRITHSRDMVIQNFPRWRAAVSWIWSNRKQVHSIRRTRKPYPRIIHEVDRIIRCRDMAISQLQLGTGKMAGWLTVAVRVSGCPVGWLVSHVCLSALGLALWPYLGNGSSDQLRFWHAAEGRQARECVPCVARPACVSTPGTRQRREYNPRA